MLYKRLFYFAWLIGVFVLWFLEGRVLSTIFLVATIVFSVMSFLNVLFLKNKLKFTIEAPDYVKMNKKKSVVIHMKNNGYLPAFSVTGTILVHNMATGEQSKIPVWLGGFPGGEQQFQFKIHSAHCGLIRISFQDLLCNDLLGVFSTKIETDFELYKNIYVMPALPEEYPAVMLKPFSKQRNMKLFLETQLSVECSDPAAEANLRLHKFLEYSYGCALRKIAHELIYYNETGSSFIKKQVTNVADFDHLLENILRVSFSGSSAECRYQTYLQLTQLKENRFVVVQDLYQIEEEDKTEQTTEQPAEEQSNE